LAAGLAIEMGVAFFTEALATEAFATDFLAAAGAAVWVFDDFGLAGILLLLNEYDERRD
jgi:hypothetical protein